MRLPQEILRRLAVLLAAVWLASGCSQQPANNYQGYVEGEFVYMASSQAGQLLDLAVQRGQTRRGRSVCSSTLEAQSERTPCAQSRASAAGRPGAARGHAHRQARAGGRGHPGAARPGARRCRTAGPATASATRSSTAPAACPRGSRMIRARRPRAPQAHVRELAAQLEVARLPNREQQIRAQQS